MPMRQRNGWDNFSRNGPHNCRSLGYARDDKGDGGASIESGCRIYLMMNSAVAEWVMEPETPMNVIL